MEVVNTNGEAGGETAPRPALRIALAGATGTIGRATLRALRRRGHEVVCFFARKREEGAASIEGAAVRCVDFAVPVRWRRTDFAASAFDAVVSCMASRTGAPKDAWAVDHQAHINLLAAAQGAGVRHFVQLSAICVQKPLLAFQHAKLAFEQALVESGSPIPSCARRLSSNPCRDKSSAAKGQAVPDVRRRDADRLQADRRRRPRRLSRGMPGGSRALEPGAAHRRSRRGDHAETAGRNAVPSAGPPAQIQQGSRRPARRDHRRAGCAGRSRRVWRKKPNSRGSAATTPPNPCWP